MEIKLNHDLSDSLKRAEEIQAMIPESLKATIDMLKPMNEVFKKLAPLQETFQKMSEGIRNNPEFNFLLLIDSPNLSEEETLKRIRIVDENLLSILDKLSIKHLWVGANFALSTDEKMNPEKIRHFFISVRTIIEYLIDTLLAPEVKVKDWEKYPALLDAHKNNNCSQTISKIPRRIRIKYFCSKVQFGLIEEFTEKEIIFINSQYKEVCKVHTPQINIEKKKINLIRLHTGTTIWLLAKLYLIIEGKE